MAKQEEAKTAQFTINEEGIVVDKEGAPFQFGDGDEALPVQITNAQTQGTTDKAVEDRLARAQRQNKKQLEILQAQADKTPELQLMIDDLTKTNDQLSGELKAIEQQAEHKVKTQFDALEKRAQEAERLLKREKSARVLDGVKNRILSHSKATKFFNPGKDIAPDLLKSHKRESKPDAPDEFIDLFRVLVPDEEDGDPKMEWVNLDAAMEATLKRSDMSHYIIGSGSSGSGPSGSGGKFENKAKKPSEMTSEEWTAYKQSQGIMTPATPIAGMTPSGHKSNP